MMSSSSSSSSGLAAETAAPEGVNNDVGIDQCVVVCPPSHQSSAGIVESELINTTATTTSSPGAPDCSSFELWDYDDFMARHSICNSNNQTITSTNSSGSGTVTGSSTTTTTTAAATEEQRPVVTLKFLTSALVGWVDAVAERFNAERPDVIVDVVSVPLAELAPNIINEATSKTGLFDGFVTPPTVMGSIVQEDGWADLRPYIESTAKATADWSDIFLSYRKWISQYQNKILMYPLDGDLMSMFYRADILEEFGLNVPRTWDEYNEVAAATHGKISKRTNQTLIGSCVGRVPGCAGAYFANLVLSSMTQLDGFSQGHLFDTSTMNPLLGEAFTQMLEWMEIQVKYGPPDQFEQCIDLTNRYMNQGTCVLTYNWGNTFKVYLNEGSIFTTDSGAKMGVAPTPGSPRVLDRDSMKLVPCDQDRCRFARYYEDIGWVNSAPYLAFGGWSCSVNNYTTPGKKSLAAEFCAFASSRQQSDIFVTENATTALSGADPFRTSQLDINTWVENGYQQNAVEEYFSVISSALASENAVTDIRFPTSSEIYAALDEEVTSHLNRTTQEYLTDAEHIHARTEVLSRLQSQFSGIISEYDAAATTRAPVLVQYQKLRNVYTVDYNYNQLGRGIRAYGFSVASLSLATAMMFALWTWCYRKSPVVRASQPFFLILICLGAFVTAASIFPMAIDDGFASEEACSRACMSVPWLLVMGFSFIFSALYAKIRRVNLVISNAVAFRHIKVSEKDVMLPFAILFTANVVLLTAWTVTDPLRWERIPTGLTSSYGICTIHSEGSAWKVIVSLIAIINGAALLASNVEAYKARKVDTAYGESSYIGLIMASWLQIILVGLPLSFLVAEQPTARFFVNSSMAFLMTMSVLLLLFLPKWRSWKKRNSGESGGAKQPRNFYISGLSAPGCDNNEINSIKQSRSIALESGSRAELSINQQVNPGVERSYEEIWNERVHHLQEIMREAGIDAHPYLQEAKMVDVEGVPLSISSHGTPTGIAVQAKISKRSLDSSLNAVSENDIEALDVQDQSSSEIVRDEKATPLKLETARARAQSEPTTAESATDHECSPRQDR